LDFLSKAQGPYNNLKLSLASTSFAKIEFIFTTNASIWLMAQISILWVTSSKKIPHFPTPLGLKIALNSIDFLL
jgi:hypothetical protein